MMRASKAPQGALLIQKMIDARAETDRHIRIIERQISARAERMTVTQKSKARSFRHGTSRWTNAHEALLDENIGQVRFERRQELDALIRKRRRQDRAIETLKRIAGTTAINGTRPTNP